MIGFIIGAVLAVFIADAVYARARIKLRTRAEESARPRSHEIIHRSSRGWHEIGEAEQPEAEVESFSRIDSILGGNARRPHR